MSLVVILIRSQKSVADRFVERKGALMRVSPVHSLINNQYRRNGAAFMQNFSTNAFNKLALQNKLNQNDVFVRLAAASTRDARIEKELTDMGLI